MWVFINIIYYYIQNTYNSIVNFAFYSFLPSSFYQNEWTFWINSSNEKERSEVRWNEVHSFVFILFSVAVALDFLFKYISPNLQPKFLIYYENTSSISFLNRYFILFLKKRKPFARFHNLMWSVAAAPTCCLNPTFASTNTTDDYFIFSYIHTFTYIYINSNRFCVCVCVSLWIY